MNYLINENRIKCILRNNNQNLQSTIRSFQPDNDLKKISIRSLRRMNKNVIERNGTAWYANGIKHTLSKEKKANIMYLIHIYCECVLLYNFRCANMTTECILKWAGKKNLSKKGQHWKAKDRFFPYCSFFNVIFVLLIVFFYSFWLFIRVLSTGYRTHSMRAISIERTTIMSGRNIETIYDFFFLLFYLRFFIRCGTISGSTQTLEEHTIFGHISINT